MTYDKAFFDTQAPVAYRSALAVLPDVIRELDAKTVIDVGCGVGAWAGVAHEEGCKVKGVDGHVETTQLFIEDSEFERVDLAQGYDCTGWDLALCLEVAEHLPEQAQAPLVAGLCKAKHVLFSGGHPGQLGVGHICEQWGTWWESLFNSHDFTGSSHLKWRHWNDPDIAVFYRENLLLFSGTLDPVSPVVDVLHPSRYQQWP